MKNFIQDGNSITITAPYTVAAGAGVMVGALFGIAVDAITSGATGDIWTEGVYDVAKDSSTFSAGDLVFWDNTNKNATSTAAGNKRIGRATQAQVTGDATVRVVLDEGTPTRYFVSPERTATGSAETVAHGLGFIPNAVMAIPTDTSPATAGVFTVTEGSHTSTNVIITVTASKKYKILALLF